MRPSRVPGPVVLKRDAWVSHSQRQLDEVWWPTLRAHHLFYKNLGLLQLGPVQLRLGALDRRAR